MGFVAPLVAGIGSAASAAAPVLGAVGTIASVAGGLGGGGDMEFQQVENLTPEQSELLGRFSLKGIEELERKTLPFPGQLTAPTTALQQAAFRNAGSTFGRMNGLQNDVYSNIQQYLPTILQGPEMAMRTFDQSVAGPARRGFAQELLPQITERFVNTGTLDSSGFNRTATRAAADLEKDLAGQRASYLQNAYQQMPANLTSMANLGQMQAQQQRSNLYDLLGIGTQQQQLAQSDIDRQFAEFIRTQQSPSVGFQAIQGSPLNVSAFDTLVQPGSSGISGLGGLGSLLGSGGLGGLFGGGNTGGGYAPIPPAPQIQQPNPYLHSPSQFYGGGYYA